MIKEVQKKGIYLNTKYIGVAIIYRYLRLTPSLAFMLMVYYRIVMYLGMPLSASCNDPALCLVFDLRDGGEWGWGWGMGTHRANPRAPAAQGTRSPTPRGSGTQWATTGAPEASCGNVWLARKGKEPPTQPGWEEPRTRALAQRSASHPCLDGGAHDTCVNHKGARATRGGARDTLGNHEGARIPTCTTRRDGVIAPHTHMAAWGGRWRTTRTTLGGVEQLGLTHTETRRDIWWTTWMRRGVGSENRKTTPAAASTTPSAPTTGLR